MYFTTENSLISENKSEALKREYLCCLRAGDIEGLFDLYQKTPRDIDPFHKDIRNLAINNSIRLCISNKEPKRAYSIICDTEEDEGIEGKIEYYEEVKEYKNAVLLINRLLKKENDSLLIRKRERLRKLYFFSEECANEVKKTEIAEDDLFSLFWKIFHWIEDGSISRISQIEVEKKGREEERAWMDGVVSWIQQEDFPVSKEYLKNSFSSSVFFSDGGFCLESPSGETERIVLDTFSCISRVLTGFSIVWEGDFPFLDTKYSFYIAYLHLLEYLPTSYISPESLAFSCRYLFSSFPPAFSEAYPEFNPRSSLNSLIRRVSYSLWSAGKNLVFPATKSEALSTHVSLISEQKELNDLLLKYLIDHVDPLEIFLFLSKNPFFDLKASSLVFRVLEKGILFSDANIILLCAIILESVNHSALVDLFPKCSCYSLSFLLSRIMYNKSIPPSYKMDVFLRMASPVKEMFTYNQVVSLLLLAPKGTSIPFFSGFIRGRAFLLPMKIYEIDGDSIYLSGSAFSRSHELLKKYLKVPEKAYLSSFKASHPVYKKILPILLHRKEYELAAAIDPFSGKIFASYIHHLHAQATSVKPDKKHGPSMTLELCKKICSIYSFLLFNIKKINGISFLSSTFTKGLSSLLSLELTLTKKPNRIIKNISCTKNEIQLAVKALQTIRLRCSSDSSDSSEREASVEYRHLICYDLWKISSFSGTLSSASISVLLYACKEIEELSLIELNYLVIIRINRINEDFWGKLNFFSKNPKEETRSYIIDQKSVKKIYSEYISYLSRQNEDVSWFFFSILMRYPEIEDSLKEDLLDYMFFDENNQLITEFSSWIPNLSLFLRKEYFNYLFNYYEEKNPQFLKTLKSEIRKRGFIIE
ncbi:hypothetical protein NEFER03_0280 [Nematocida sp. LUAm3]|nr:hypothetical protein NEFER03_0280 [Nematocida sp. LUAm3]